MKSIIMTTIFIDMQVFLTDLFEAIVAIQKGQYLCRCYSIPLNA